MYFQHAPVPSLEQLLTFHLNAVHLSSTATAESSPPATVAHMRVYGTDFKLYFDQTRNNTTYNSLHRCRDTRLRCQRGRGRRPKRYAPHTGNRFRVVRYTHLSPPLGPHLNESFCLMLFSANSFAVPLCLLKVAREHDSESDLSEDETMHVQRLQAENGKFYYYNYVTKKSTWKPLEGCSISSNYHAGSSESGSETAIGQTMVDSMPACTIDTRTPICRDTRGPETDSLGTGHA